MNNRRIIKKYPNRRLYDTEDSKYITLEDIRILVIKNKEFVVIDAKTRDDLTRNILLQIIIEKEQNSEPIFSIKVLAQIIRSYENSFQHTIGNQLEKNIEKLIYQYQNQQQQYVGSNTTRTSIKDED